VQSGGTSTPLLALVSGCHAAAAEDEGGDAGDDACAAVVAAAPLCRSAALPAADSSAPRAQVLNLIVVKSKAL